MSDVKKVVLAYSGGLDTSVILKWLQDSYQCEVVTFTADLGQGEEEHHHGPFRPLPNQERPGHGDGHQGVHVEVAVLERNPALLVGG